MSNGYKNIYGIRTPQFSLIVWIGWVETIILIIYIPFSFSEKKIWKRSGITDNDGMMKLDFKLSKIGATGDESFTMVYMMDVMR